MKQDTNSKQAALSLGACSNHLMASALRNLWLLLFAISAFGQSQQQWVQRYCLASFKTNQAGAIALTPDGSVIVAGSSASTNGDLDYVAVKYSATGQQMWLTRYDSPGHGQDRLRGMALDNAGNAILTGTSTTVQLGANGGIGWSAPYGGRAVATDTNGNSYVTGFSDLDYATVKLDQYGSNLWIRTFSYITTTNVPDIAQAIAVGLNGTVAVSGYETHNLFPYRQFRTISYDADGNVLWSDDTPIGGPLGEQTCTLMDVDSVVVDKQGRVCFLGNFCAGFAFATRCYDPAGAVQWDWVQDTDAGHDYGGLSLAMVMDSTGALVSTGSRFGPPTLCTYKLGTNGHKIWLATYSGPGSGQNQGTAVALDSAGNVYVTGYSPGVGSGNDIVTIKYDSNGNQLWVQRYNGPANGDDIPTGIVVDGKGGVYVTGYSATTNGGTEFVTIKYLDRPSIGQPQKRGDGNFQFQLNSWVGQTNTVESSSNLTAWSALTSIVVTNVPMPVVDLGASNFPSRFYRVRSP